MTALFSRLRALFRRRRTARTGPRATITITVGGIDRRLFEQ
jgi:hypothetical protein